LRIIPGPRKRHGRRGQRVHSRRGNKKTKKFFLTRFGGFIQWPVVPHTKTAVDSPYRVQVLDRALAILDELGHQQSECSLAELSHTVGLHKSTVHRLIMVLERHRLIEKNRETGRYRLGLKLFELGSKAIGSTDLCEHSRPHLSRVMYETEETVHFCILDQGEVLYVEKMEPQRSVRMASSVGRRAPAHCTAVGKAMLAELPASEVEDIVRQCGLRSMTRKTITTPGELRAELRAIHARGYSIDDEEHEDGVRCVGAAVRDYHGRPVAAISVSGPAFRITKEKVPVVARSVVEAANALSTQLGYKATSLPLVSAKAI
jgi:DNA-binding IclR family transcriptional regulator